MDKKEMMFELVKQWRKSSVTRKVFANEHDITEASFDYWCKKQYNEVVKAGRTATAPRKPQSAMPGFIELTSSLDMNIQKQPMRIELELSGGIRIKIY